MKFWRYGLALVLIVALALSVVGCSKEPLAATVNGKNITVAEVDKRLEQMSGQHTQTFEGPQGQELKEQFRLRILDQIIDQELLLQEADKRGIKVSDKEADAKIKEIMQTYNFKDEKALEDALKQQKLTMAEFKEELNRSLRIEKLGEQITKKVKMSDKELEKYYKENQAEFAAGDQVHVQHILVQKEDEAKKILADLKNGADFKKLAKEHSKDPGSKDTGGELPWTDKDKFVPEFAAASWALEKGQLSEPVKTSYGFHVIKLLDKRPAGQRTFAEVKGEIEDKLVLEKKRDAFNQWLEKTRKQASIKKLLTAPKTESQAGASGGAVPPAPGGTTQPQGGAQQPQPQAQPGK